MATKLHKPEEIVTKLRQVEALVGQGMARVGCDPRDSHSQHPQTDPHAGTNGPS